MKLNYKKGLNIFLLVAIIGGIVGFVTFGRTGYAPNDFIINIKDEHENHFIQERDVESIIREIGINNPGILRDKGVNLKRLEEEIQNIEFIREAQVSRDLTGNLVVDISQNTPIARIMSSSGKGGYLSEDKSILSLSNRYTSRVLVITGSGADSLFREGFLTSEKGSQIIEFIDTINEDTFWKAQFSQMDLSEKLEATMYPQVGKQKIEFGRVENVKLKLGKLKTFYEEIVPKKGWNKYSKVKLQFDGQIVCE